MECTTNRTSFSAMVILALLMAAGHTVQAGENATRSAPVVENHRQYFAAPRIVGKEDEFCRRAYEVMLKGAAFCKDLYHPWPAEPDCGYLGWGGHGEKDINSNVRMAYLYAFLTTFGQYDEQVTGVSRDEALRRVKGVLRYLCFTHVSGSRKCTTGKPWGGGWHTATWSSVLGQTAWLVWDKLDEETREMTARVLAFEADRLAKATPPSQKIDNTQAESNAWNTRALAIALVLFPDHPHATQWRDAYHRWTMNALSVAADKKDDSLVEGKPVRQWVTTENVHSDFTLENHRIVYPVYMWASMSGLCYGASFFAMAGQEPPATAYHHLRDMYTVYKQLQTWEGLPAYVNGSDKFLHMQVVDIILHSFFAQMFHDREAAHLEEVELDFLERMQARFDDGRVYPVEEVGKWSRIGDVGLVLGTCYLLHFARQADVEPFSRDEFERRITGVRYFPDGKFLLHRTPDKLVSFAWSKPYRVMGLAIPRDGSWLVTPHLSGFTGTIHEKRERGRQTFTIQSLEKKTDKDSFSITVTTLRCGGKVKHRWTFESTPGRDVIFRETLKALQPVSLERAETGTIGIGRELGSDQITLQSSTGTRRLSGPTGGPDETIEFPNGSVAVNNRFSYEWKGTGTVCYFKQNRHARVHGAPGGYGRIEDRLTVRHLQAPRHFDAGETIARGQLRVRMTANED
ncbi:MAG: hypothetical protein JW888_04685 [Pirellulales bacterium]|nr:hypothetical protein [Pirellulales bacterium]